MKMLIFCQCTLWKEIRVGLPFSQRSNKKGQLSVWRHQKVSFFVQLISRQLPWREVSGRGMVRSRAVHPFCLAQMPLSPMTRMCCSLENSKNKNFAFGPQHVPVLTVAFNEINLHFSSMALNKCQSDIISTTAFLNSLSFSVQSTES